MAALFRRCFEPNFLRATGRLFRHYQLDLLAFGPHPAGQRGVTGQIDTFFDRENGRQGHLIHLPTTRCLPLGNGRAILQFQLLNARDTRQIQRLGHPNADLIATGVGRFVAKQQQIE